MKYSNLRFQQYWNLMFWKYWSLEHRRQDTQQTQQTQKRRSTEIQKHEHKSTKKHRNTETLKQGKSNMQHIGLFGAFSCLTLSRTNWKTSLGRLRRDRDTHAMDGSSSAPEPHQVSRITCSFTGPTSGPVAHSHSHRSLD